MELFEMPLMIMALRGASLLCIARAGFYFLLWQRTSARSGSLQRRACYWFGCGVMSAMLSFLFQKIPANLMPQSHSIGLGLVLLAVVTGAYICRIVSLLVWPKSRLDR